MTTITCCAYRSPKKEALYLFTAKDKKLDDLPETMLVMFGQPEFIFDFELSSTRHMAKEDPAVVWRNINEKGYHIQMPPTEAEKKANQLDHEQNLLS